MSTLPKGWFITDLGTAANYGVTEKVEPTDIASDEWVLELEDIEKNTSKLVQRVQFRDRNSKSTKNRFAAGDVLYGKLRPNLNKVIIADEPGVCTTEILPLRCPGGIESKYVFYSLKRPEFLEYVTATNHGIDMPRLGTEAGKAARLPLPPHNEQRRIVAKLDSLSARSTHARYDLDRIPQLIALYKQAILTKAFSGELTADWRSERRQDAQVFMKKVGIGEASTQPSDNLPNGWHWVNAGDLCAIKSGIALGKKRQAGTKLIELPYLRVANVQRGWLNLVEIKSTLVAEKEAEALYLMPGDVLMNEGGDRDKLGRGWVWEGQIANCIHQNHVFRLRPKSKDIPSRYISYYANEFGQRYFLDEGKQTTNLASISMSKVAALPIPLCTPDEMRLIIKRIEFAFAWIDKIATEHTRAAHLLPKLDQAILAKAFRGELVPQDPNDEPASVLLERIQAERADAKPSTRRKPMPSN
jgi:type I restriction enzyme S subunit